METPPRQGVSKPSTAEKVSMWLSDPEHLTPTPTTPPRTPPEDTPPRCGSKERADPSRPPAFGPRGTTTLSITALSATTGSSSFGPPTPETSIEKQLAALKMRRRTKSYNSSFNGTQGTHSEARSTPSSSHLSGPPTPAKQMSFIEKDTPTRKQLNLRAMGDEEEDDDEQIRPVEHPDKALQGALEGIKGQEWKQQQQSLVTIRCLARYHQDVIQPSLHSTTLAVLAQCDNLRSGVAKTALETITEICCGLQGAVDPHADVIALVLVAKIGSTNKFLAESAHECCKEMVHNLSASRCATTFMSAYANQKAEKCKVGIAELFLLTLEKWGTGVVDSKELPKVVQMIAKLLNEGSQEIRTAGKASLHTLARQLPEDEFERVVNRNISQPRMAEKMIDMAIKKSCSEKLSQSLPPGRSPDRRVQKGKLASTSHRTAPPALAPESDYMAVVNGINGASEWRERVGQLAKLLELIRAHQTIDPHEYNAVIDCVTAKCTDQNIRAQTTALQCAEGLASLLPSSTLEYSLPRWMAGLCGGLQSSSASVRELGAAALDALMLSCNDKTTLAQQLSNTAAGTKSPQARIIIIAKLAHCVPLLPKNDTLNLLAFSFRMAFDARGDVRQAASKLVVVLHDVLEVTLFGATAFKALSADQQAKIRDMTIDS